MNILALDLGTKCGWAHSCGLSGVWDLRNRRDEGGGSRLLRLRGKVAEIHRIEHIDLVAYEAARHGAPKMQGALVVLAEMQGQIKAWCDEHHVAYHGYSPTEIKRHATGKGNASKAMMLEAARKQWPDAVIIDDNHADAMLLLDLAATEYDGN